MVELRPLESYLTDNLLSLTGNKLSFQLAPDLLKVYESLSESYDKDLNGDHPFNAIAASKMKVSEVLNLSFTKFLIEAHLLKIGAVLIEKDLLDKGGQKIFNEFQNSLELPEDFIDLLLNHSPEKEITLCKKYNVPNTPSINFSLLPEFFHYIGNHQDILAEEDPKKITEKQEELISNNIKQPLNKLFGFLFNPLVRSKEISGSSIYPYKFDKKLGSGFVGDSFLEGVLKEILKQNSQVDYLQIPKIKYVTDIINVGYSFLDSEIFDHYKNAIQSFFLTPFYTHTVNINLHLPSPIFSEGLLKEGIVLRKEIGLISDELSHEIYSKKITKSLKKILIAREKILQRGSQISIAGNVVVSKEKKFHDLYPQIKAKEYPKSTILKRIGKIREFKLKLLEEPLLIYGQRKEDIHHIDDIPTILKMITFFSLSGKGIHGAEIEGERIKPRLRTLHKTQIKIE